MHDSRYRPLLRRFGVVNAFRIISPWFAPRVNRDWDVQYTNRLSELESYLSLPQGIDEVDRPRTTSPPVQTAFTDASHPLSPLTLRDLYVNEILRGLSERRPTSNP